MIRIFLLVCVGLVFARPDVKMVLNNGQTPIVTSSLGQYQGTLMTTRLGKQIFAFRGIPYAQPPVNELRFKPPVSVAKHEGVFNASEDGAACPQNTVDPISENCLLLNIYTTKLPKGGEHPKLAVLVYIHSGEFSSLSGRSNRAGPEYLLDQDVLLVTLNYRLGVLGFLSTGDKEAPGNNGLKDQVMALRWLKENIEAFGGDVNSITLYGYNAGAVSVSLHLMSPMSKGLYHKVIMSGASALGQWPFEHNQMNLAKKLAKAVGCPDDTSANIIKCLKGKPANELGQSQSKLAEFGNEPLFTWKPVIEGDFGQERFLLEHPVLLAREGKFEKVPMLTGVTTDEFAGRAVDIYKHADLLKQLEENWENTAPIVFMYERDTDHSKTISKALRSYYFGDKKFDNSTVSHMTQLYADGLTGFAVNRGVKLLAEKNTQPVFYYKFNYKGRYSHYYLPDSNGTIPYGVAHHDDLIYLFYVSANFPKIGASDAESPTVEKMTSMWANFAKQGKPIPDNNEKLDSAKWEPFNIKSQRYLDIGNKLTVAEKLFEKRYGEWDKLFPYSFYNKFKSSMG
ncbi:juvenile hormone esterase-like [Harmonia axyridis]|uniref:juvenile hormone esterase-like n=1 Tax=Harmonia axyridis TaxID=115357 RepID=UPI001E2786E1|nr:juvenile hormone esterase-like [Harmonia axyridis]